MTLTALQLERALQQLRVHVCKDSAVAAEFAASRLEFFKTPAHHEATEQRLASRRHVEWFLLERPCTALGGVPIESVVHGGEDLGDELDEPALQALLTSICGVFEVTAVTEGEGVWARDLASAGEYPLEEPEGSRALERGDLLIGRLFPVGDSLHRLSPAAGIFRDAKLLRALHADFEHARTNRRGVVRLSQAEIESMFWNATDDVVEDAVDRARAFFATSGMERAAIEQVLGELARTPFDESRIVLGGGDTLGRILDGLAFDTGVDLDQARAMLLAAWRRLRKSEPVPSQPQAAHARGDVRSAIAAFDQGRSQGRDLEQLFMQLERDLELDDEGDAAGEEMLAPDFPGVVGAMIEEFLWEVREEQGEEVAARYATLSTFAAFGEQFGVFENLGARELVWFTTVWLPESRGLATAEQAHELLSALRDFCGWSERVHDVPLAVAFDEHLARVADSLPRLIEANQTCEHSAQQNGELYALVSVGGERAHVRDRAGGEHDVRIARELLARLRPGDRLRAQREGDVLRVFCCYPAESAALERELS